ncbi:unnamed protein product, partial [Ectocarpus sp. 12 AP-2014]
MQQAFLHDLNDRILFFCFGFVEPPKIDRFRLCRRVFALGTSTTAASLALVSRSFSLDMPSFAPRPHFSIRLSSSSPSLLLVFLLFSPQLLELLICRYVDRKPLPTT